MSAAVRKRERWSVVALIRAVGSPGS